MCGGDLDAAQDLQQPPWRRLRGGAAGTQLLPADQPRRSQRHRPATRAGILATLPAEAYRKGLAQLATAVRAQGAQAIIGSEVTLVEVAAVKDEQPRPKRRKRPFDAPARAAESEVIEVA